MKKIPNHEQVDFLQTLIKGNVLAIVENTDAVRLDCATYPGSILVTVHVAPSDMGLVLGSQGATADAIRRIVWTACKKTDLRCGIDFMENGRR